MHRNGDGLPPASADQGTDEFVERFRESDRFAAELQGDGVPVVGDVVSGELDNPAELPAPRAARLVQAAAHRDIRRGCGWLHRPPGPPRRPRASARRTHPRPALTAPLSTALRLQAARSPTTQPPAPRPPTRSPTGENKWPPSPARTPSSPSPPPSRPCGPPTPSGTNWVQTSVQSADGGQHDRNPGQSSRIGRLACTRHVIGLTLTKALLLALAAVVLDLPLGLAGVTAGLGLDAASHWWADRRSSLTWLAEVTGKSEFYSLGTGAHPAHPITAEGKPAGHLGTGAYALDLLCTNQAALR
ncbi:hypothetical protein [Streptomyces xantholiticus]|uniref:hypothetical protein n=1 Tax=Streptomyces xantholiticus TaxID=68285 RepID=UPI0019C939DA|nr:hypothetical protein [Streptomyces xantholiticus]GGW72651.1 hypothetical protein GCM10010381_66740 [Streptomyces xantholiticus]